MHRSALLSAALLAMAVTLGQGDEIPKRKPGLWELHWHSNDVTQSQAAGVLPDSAKMCIGDNTDEKIAAFFDPCNPPLYFAFFSPQFKKEVACEATDNDLKFKLTSHAKVTFSGDTAYRIEVTTRLEPAVRGEGEYSGVREGKWVGTCPADMRPGDLIAGDEPKMNVVERLMKHDD